MSTELSSEARRLIQAARGFEDASVADRERLRARIATQLAAGGDVSLASDKSWLSRTLGSNAGAKALGLVLATGAAVAVVWPSAKSTKSLAPGEAVVVASPSATEAVAAGSGRSTEVEVTPAPPQPLVSEPEPGAAAPVLEAPPTPAAPVLVEALPAARHTRPAPPPAHRATRTAPEAPSAAPSSQLEQELKLLSAAREGLKRGDTALAMERLEEHERRFGAGILAMEARALGVDALCAADRREAAREAAQAFLQRWPESPLAARVRSACP